MSATFPPLFRDSLLEGGRANRPPLREWAVRLMGGLEGLDWSDPEVRTRLSTIQNNASLIEVYRGRHAAARELCERQLWWAAQLVEAHGARACGSLAFQPWINLGRLLRLGGDGAKALPHFSLILAAASAKDVVLGPVRLDGATLRALSEDDVTGSVLKTVYIIDTTKTLLGTNDGLEAERFLERASAVVGSDPYPLLDEMRVLVHARLGRPAEALQAAEAAAWEYDSYTALVGATYRAALRSALVSPLEGRARAATLAARVLRGRAFARPADTRVLRYLQALGAFVQHVGLPQEAADLFRLGVQASRHLSDVPSEVSFLDAWLPLAGAEQARGVLDRETLLRQSLYGRPGAASAADAGSEGVFSDLYAKLDAAISTARALSRAS